VTLEELVIGLEGGRVSAVALAGNALEAIERQYAQNIPAFIHVDQKAVLAEARESDQRRKEGRALSRFDGIPFAVKDLFDVKGQVTTAGSVLLKDANPAAADSDAVVLLRNRGLVVLGRTNMTEFAYSGVGLNPHYGTPASVFDRKVGRIPGGSSSGSAVAVADGVCALALGTDTGGSCRIPAAFNGIVGFKPTASRISKRGVFPLSVLFDSIGPLASSATCCAIADDILAGGEGRKSSWKASRPLKLAVLKTHMMDGLAPEVDDAFQRTLKLLGKSAEISILDFHALVELQSLMNNGGILAYEAWHLHKQWLETRESEYDPRVASRIRFGANTDTATFAQLLDRRSALIEAFRLFASGFDAVICPTVPMPPPKISELASDDGYRRLNVLALRNTYVFNFLDGCAGSIPMQGEGEPPMGLMLAQAANHDRQLLAVMQEVERMLQ
jgi:aspartyl-tRNA(Asn)/glutamyl-tRNA(Gln) amidotransferase subunit A